MGQSAFRTYAEANAYHRTNTVREPGEYALRGGIIDVFPPGGSVAVRLDLFGDEIESIKTFDPETQRSGDLISHVRLYPVSEIPMDEASITRFRRHYIDSFGGIASRDVLYQVVSTGRRVTGIEHYLPLFHDDLTHLSEYCDNMLVVQADETAVMRQNRFEQIQDFYTARSEYAQAETNSDEVFRPLPPEALYLTDNTHAAMQSGQAVVQFMSFISDINSELEHIVINSKKSPLLYQNQSAHDDHDLAELRQLLEHRGASQTAILAASSRGGLERLSSRLEQYMTSTNNVHIISSWKDMVPAAVNLMVWPLEHGFIMPELFVLTEQDIFGRRLHRPQGRRRRAEHFLREVSSLNEGDLVVHVDHGIGRYENLETLNILGADHDCVLLVYAGGDKLYLPVENIDLLSRYGREGGEVALDKLGGVAWQAKKARIKKRIKDIAGQLIKVAALRKISQTEQFYAEPASYSEFCQRFPYAETEDQQDAIDETLNDMRSGRVMDRLICGDVGFGKTEVAMRAAFVAAMSGYQVAVVTPTTLLARQHGKVFTERFNGFGIEIGVLSRMTTTKQANQIKEGLANGDVQIAIGTHALLSKQIQFSNLGLIIVDEEQHFGVTRKSVLKPCGGYSCPNPYRYTYPADIADGFIRCSRYVDYCYPAGG